MLTPQPQRFLALLKVLCVRIHTPCLRHEKESGDGTQQVASEEDPQHVRDTDFLRAEVVEKHT